MPSPPQMIVLAGPNGAGKSTAAAHLLPAAMPFVNADEIAKGLPNYPSRGADIEAGRIVLELLEELERRRVDFAVETTLSGRSLAPRIARLRRSGYLFQLFFAYLPSPDAAVRRVAGRVLMGGHNIPEETIRRRYRAGIANFFQLYQPLADEWAICDTSQSGPPKLIAEGRIDEGIRIHDHELWRRFRGEVRDE